MLVTRVSEIFVDGFSFSRFRRTYQRIKGKRNPYIRKHPMKKNPKVYPN